MNDTISPRQARILNRISASDGMKRDEIQSEISVVDDISKPTLIRDINTLIGLKRIKSMGKGPATIYVAYDENPLLKDFDTESYFAAEPDRRHANPHFDFSVFRYLDTLLTRGDSDILKKHERNFTAAASNLDRTILKRELERFVIELSWKSSKIEGNTYTLLETETLIKNSIEAKGRSREESVMILNHKAAFDAIVENPEDFSQLNLTVMNQLHNMLVKDLQISTGLRKQPVGITGTVYRPLDNEHQIREAMESMITAVNRTANPYEKALIVYLLVPYIQPYSDGNKRTGRMLANAILLANDLFPLSYRSVNEEEFKQALILFYEQMSAVSAKRIFIDQFVFANRTYFPS